MTDVADDGLILHFDHVLMGDDVVVAGAGDKNIGLVSGVIHGHHAVAFHRRLQGTDRVDFRYPDLGGQSTQRLCRAFAHIAVTADQRHLAGNHHVGRAFDAVDQRFAATVEVVELGFGHRIIDVDRREFQISALMHLVEAMHAGGGFLGHAANLGETG